MNKNHLLFAVFFSLMVFVEAVSAVGKQRIISTADNHSSASKPETTATISVDVTKGKKISDHLFGIFFEDLNYAADGGLYAELIQNRSFEYSPADRKGEVLILQKVPYERPAPSSKQRSDADSCINCIHDFGSG